MGGLILEPITAGGGVIPPVQECFPSIQEICERYGLVLIFTEFLNDPSEKPDYFHDISTYGGCTGGFAAALENMRIVEAEDLVENARVVGEYLLDRLRELSDHPNVGEVRGKGLFAGLEIVAAVQVGIEKGCRDGLG